MVARGTNNSTIPSGPPGATDTVDSGTHLTLNVSQQLMGTGTDFLFRFQHEMGIGSSTSCDIGAGGVSQRAHTHASPPRCTSLFGARQVPSPQPFIYSPSRAVSSSVSAVRCGKIHQVSLPSGGKSSTPPGRSALPLASSSAHIILPTPASSPTRPGPVTKVKFYGLLPVTQYHNDFPFEIPHWDSPAPFYCVTKGRRVGVITTW